MAKYCNICGIKLGLFSVSFDLKNGVICNSCTNEFLKTVGYNSSKADFDMSCFTIYIVKEKLKQTNINIMPEFEATTNIDGYLEIDEKNKLLRIKAFEGDTASRLRVLSFDDIINYEIIDNKKIVTKNKGTLGRAFTGGLIFGPLGAIIGGSTSKKVSKEKTINHTIQINLKSSYKPISIVVHKEDIKQNIVSVLENILHHTEKSFISNNNDNISLLREYKQLFDEGLITEEEYYNKKQQILNKN